MSATVTPVQRSAPSLSAGKIQASHLKRLAVVYVRQSTLQQVERHQESTRLQYALAERASWRQKNHVLRCGGDDAPVCRARQAPGIYLRSVQGCLEESRTLD
jgi:hypothetical protein